MFERATDDVIALATVAAAAVMAVFAAGFAIFAGFRDAGYGDAWAAAIVAALAALVVGIFATVAIVRKNARDKAKAEQQARLMEQMPNGLSELARDRPIVTLAVSLLGGALAARHPNLARDLISIVARFAKV